MTRCRTIHCLWIALALVCVGCGSEDPPSDPVRSLSPGDATVDVRPQPENYRVIASQALGRGDLGNAQNSIRQHLLQQPGDAVAIELAGDIAVARGDIQEASSMYQSAVDLSDRPSLALLRKHSELQMKSNRPFEAVETLRRSSELYPDDIQGHYDLVGLSAMVGLPQLAIPSLKWLLMHGHGDPESLAVLADPGRVEPDSEMCLNLMQREPTDRRPEFCLAQRDASQMDWQAAADRLGKVSLRHPEFVPAYAWLGLALARSGRYDEIPDWAKQMPDGAPTFPEYWIAMGLWAQSQGRYESAARSFWEALNHDQMRYPETLTSLLVCLKQMGRDSDAELVADQIVRQTSLRDALAIHFERKSNSQKSALKVAEALVALGRIWEAEGWARLATVLPDDHVDDLRDRYLAIRKGLSKQTPWQLSGFDIAQRIDLSGLALVDPTPGSPGVLPAVAASAARLDSTPIRFDDQSKQRGLNHTCAIAPDAQQDGHWIYQTVGGGVAVIDFDLDGYPDVAAAVLDGQPLATDSSLNGLHRNIAGQFVDVTVSAGYLDHGFGQGIAVGDYNDDGFPDLFDANIGGNRLYRNNGDGTFTDVTEQAKLSGAKWTTSVVIADIDSDGIADLFEVAYCDGESPFRDGCHNAQGISTCPPLHFEAATDRVWKGVGDGTFVDVTERWMDQRSPGRGLGIVAGQLDETPGLDLYVANDMTVNHLWSASQQSGQFELVEIGAIRGLGLNARSLSQASMGMAAGDPDGDGDIDFFLSHFADDHNTFYEQVGPGVWSDRSHQVGLAQPSIKLLGFGTQWADFNNDGELELILTNGHVDDVGRDDVSYYMPTQVFHRSRNGSWDEIDRQQLGPFFERDHLGRALAIADINVDGKADAIVSHLYEPVALLVNDSDGAGASVTFELKSTSGQRDAIGAVVRAKVGDRQVAGQLLSGDGYMASNQRRVRFGVGNQTVVRDVSVDWGRGNVQEIGDLPTGKNYVLVEGFDTAFQTRER
ncbi:FG-GAP-like repeat-containing protein [Rubripirellula lacrimiformis]|uniref:FG-GAP-like repeat-containing protein n=1 Tax=Rubripirellula lacrimiformis TaxID=1930273 RepID=UPI001C54C800|nr:FG-GAP-like repeat-containing protein [Rubripirellula lacrimiformis]